MADTVENAASTPDQEQPWADPDHPPSAEVVDAAMDAIVALAVEASRLSEPPDPLSTRLTLFARRLRQR